jgi:hypothetical protein
MRSTWCAVIVLCLCMLPGRASAQAAWDSPLLLPPQPPDGLGLYLTDMHAGGIGFMGTWRPPVWNYGLRVGIADGSRNEDLTIFGGVDYSGPVNRATTEFPVDIDWVFGAGAGIGDGVRISLPLGLTAGHVFRGEGAVFTPYATPRVVLDAFFGGDRESSDLALVLAVDLGLDLQLATTGALSGATIRFGATLGRRNAIALGVVF